MYRLSIKEMLGKIFDVERLRGNGWSAMRKMEAGRHGHIKHTSTADKALKGN